MRQADVFLRRCENCEYFTQIFNDDDQSYRKTGRCRINPPIAHFDPEYGEECVGALPVVTAGSWCAKFSCATNPETYFIE